MRSGNVGRVLFLVDRLELEDQAEEAHRSIGGNARAVFDYFVGYMLGLTATPRDYLKRFNSGNANRKDPREFEKRFFADATTTSRRTPFGDTCRPKKLETPRQC